MKLIYGVSKWTNASRPRARHIDNGDGLPLCGEQRKGTSWVLEDGNLSDVTCKKCISNQAEISSFFADSPSLEQLAKQAGERSPFSAEDALNCLAILLSPRDVKTTDNGELEHYDEIDQMRALIKTHDIKGKFDYSSGTYVVDFRPKDGHELASKDELKKFMELFLARLLSPGVETTDNGDGTYSHLVTFEE